jgi:hypothetical protein
MKSRAEIRDQTMWGCFGNRQDVWGESELFVRLEGGCLGVLIVVALPKLTCVGYRSDIENLAMDEGLFGREVIIYQYQKVLVCKGTP